MPRDGLGFSGYLQPPAVPPDPIDEDWRGEPGPPGPPGPAGPQGTPGDLGFVLAAGSTTPRSMPDRTAEHYSAKDFGVVCDGVTDDGAALNAALALIPIGTTLYIPGSIYTTQTIVVDAGRKLVMDGNTRVRPSVGSPLIECTVKIIGASTLSPVVLCTGNETQLTGVSITRNGTPPAGAIGLQCLGEYMVFTHVYSYNHARCIQVGGLRAAPVNGRYSAITTRFDHCVVWRCYEDYVYLINAPETSFYDMRLGANGEFDPPGATSLVCIDGDLLSQDAGTVNTVTFLRCQFNPTATPLNSVRIIQYASLDGFFIFDDCYSGGAIQAFLYIDPNCTIVRNVNIIGCSIQPMQTTQTLVLDPGKRLAAFTMIGNHTSANSSVPGLSLSGVDAQIIGNRFGGAFICIMDAMTHGQFTSNTSSEIRFTGVYAGTQPFVVTGNTFATIVQTATGLINYVEPSGGYEQQLTIGRANAAGRISFRRGTDGVITSFVGIVSAAGGGVTELANTGGTPIVRLHANNTAGVVQFLVNDAMVGQSDERGMTIAKASGSATAPGAGFARLGFVNGTTAGTAKLVAYAGTSTTPTTIVDNIGAGF